MTDSGGNPILDYGLRGFAWHHRRRAEEERDRSGLDRCPDIPCRLGALGALLGGAQISKATLRVGFWETLAMAATAGIGVLVGGRRYSRCVRNMRLRSFLIFSEG
jgi:hypothetical protein